MPLLAALWLLGLLAAAPMLRTSRAPYAFPDRLRDALVLGVAIPLVLGFVHLLYPAALWIALVALVVSSVVKRAAPDGERQAQRTAGPPYLLIAATALVAWPPLMRPVLDGDSVSYHLPNAAAWVHAHGLWTTDPRYWWYPPASESFASALYAVSGPFSLPWSGVGPLLLLGWRLHDWARDRFGAPPLLADALAAAVVTAPPLALQAGTLQNDVWLAAFFTETLWSAQMRDAGAAARCAAVTALLKPYGLLFAFVAAALGRAPARVWIAAAAAAGVWAVHDAALWGSAVIPPSATSYGNSSDSTIVAHVPGAFALLVHAALASSPFVAIALLAAIAGPLLARRAGAPAWAAFFAFLFYLVMPLAYSGPGPQLANGASLRYAAPAMALGALAAIPFATGAAVAGAAVAIAFAIFGAAKNVATFASDAPTLAALGVALVTVAAAWSARRVENAWPLVAGFVVAAVAAGVLAARQPAAYYTDALTVEGKSSGLYVWLARRQPEALAGNGLALGTVNVLSPRTRTLDLSDAAPCATARSQDALLVAVAEPTRSHAYDEARLRAARACGRTLYDDGIAVVSAP